MIGADLTQYEADVCHFLSVCLSLIAFLFRYVFFWKLLFPTSPTYSIHFPVRTFHLRL